MEDFQQRLEGFQITHKVTSKGSLSVVIQLTRALREKGLPADPESFKTKRQGQVAGLGGANLRKILGEHGITRQLSAEGGRTSRGSMELMQDYVITLNAWHAEDPVDLEAVEAYWVEQVRKFFQGKPFRMSADASLSLSSSFDALFDQARSRQQENPGTQYLGTLLQHLVAAKLTLVLPEGSFEVHGASVADGPTAREGDFIVGDVAIHCTTAPASLLMQKCAKNLRDGLQPVIVTIPERVASARSLAEDEGIGRRVDVLDIAQFLTSNIYEMSFFDRSRQSGAIGAIIDEYNIIVDRVETDPSLRIRFDQKL